ncbi:MAG: flagellar export protein FliJ [Acidobacteriia bacterium]|nr:flagellar export protein FliJ [Terriglobia bacterium]
MKKFLFRLETLLQHRRNLEEKERTAFSTIRAKLRAELDGRESLYLRQAQTLSELALKKLGDCDSREIAWYYRFLDRLGQELEQSAKRIVQLEKQLEAQKQIMIEASRDKKMIENLRNKREKEFVVSLEREEQKAIDEIVVTRFPLKQ